METTTQPTNRLFHVSTDRGCGIRAAVDEDAMWRMMAREVGTSNVSEIREATEADIAWVRGMGGYIPKI